MKLKTEPLSTEDEWEDAMAMESVTLSFWFVNAILDTLSQEIAVSMMTK